MVAMMPMVPQEVPVAKPMAEPSGKRKEVSSENSGAVFGFSETAAKLAPDAVSHGGFPCSGAGSASPASGFAGRSMRESFELARSCQ